MQLPAHMTQKAIAYFDSKKENVLETLMGLSRIPSVSFDGFDFKHLQVCAERVAERAEHAGLQNVQILDLKGSHPYVYAERIKAPGAPTLLLYAHHDVQPAGREELWKSKPFEPTLRQGPGGERLYGRGTADDKAGIMVHLAAIEAFLKSGSELPVNVKVLIEGEEEIGSPMLSTFLKKHQELVAADVMVLTDSSNYDCGVPGLTVALRGLVGLGVEVRALKGSIHSGMWGGPIPDTVMALSKMLSTLVDDHGRIAVPAIQAMIPKPSREAIEEYRSLPYDTKTFREQAGLVDGASLLVEGEVPAAQTWMYPSLTITAIQASSRAQPANILNDAAWAKVTIRIVQGMDPRKVSDALQKHLKSICPWGLELKFEGEEGASAWAADPYGPHRPVFDAAHRALHKGYGKPALKFGMGGTIPFVDPFAKALGGAPALLIGVEDPYTCAHGENESLLVSDFYSACRGQIYLFDELARLKP